jgi:hypothetical protein
MGRVDVDLNSDDFQPEWLHKALEKLEKEPRKQFWDQYMAAIYSLLYGFRESPINKMVTPESRELSSGFQIPGTVANCDALQSVFLGTL